jgi:hypothetical protein
MFGENEFIFGPNTGITLTRPRLGQSPAYETLRYSQDFLNSLECPASLCRAYQFPERVSFKMELFRERSATNFFNLAFSLLSSMSLRTWAVCIPPDSRRH